MFNAKTYLKKVFSCPVKNINFAKKDKTHLKRGEIFVEPRMFSQILRFPKQHFNMHVKETWLLIDTLWELSSQSCKAPRWTQMFVEQSFPH